MDPKEFEKLLARYLDGEATPEERAQVETWYLTYRSNAGEPLPEQLEVHQEQSVKRLLAHVRRRRSLWPELAAVAAMLLVICTGAWLWTGHKQPPENKKPVVVAATKNIHPGGNKAIITLSDGTSIELDSAKTGSLAVQGNVKIDKTADGQVRYERDVDQAAAHSAYNTAVTPRGGQYEFILSDGTKVWLNAASSLRFPVAFPENERKVQVTGEAYFEVASNPNSPFLVETHGQTIQVLGTSFNVNAYDDERSVKTTLLTGSVKVTAQGIGKKLQPGEQAQYENGDLIIGAADVDNAIAWKNGYFSFKEDDMRSVMRQIARWYNIDVRYEGQIPNRNFSGEIPRSVNLSQILEILTFKKIHYRISDTALTITP